MLHIAVLRDPRSVETPVYGVGSIVLSYFVWPVQETKSPVTATPIDGVFSSAGVRDAIKKIPPTRGRDF